MDAKLLKVALAAQRNEITEYRIYMRLADVCKSESNAAVLRDIGKAERRHSGFWKTKTGIEVKADGFRVVRQVLLARLLGLTFVLKRMEKNEGTASKRYALLNEAFPETKKISEEEAEHEKALLAMLDEELLQYVGSIVLGLNDALVELTGALAGFTLALADSKIISLAGLVTGISAAFSMAASDYLSSKAEGDPRAAKSAVYTGVAYLITVILMILPFLLLSSKFVSLALTLCIVVCIIFLFNYYLSVAKDLNFKRRFWEMTLISLGVAAFSFFIGYILKGMLGIDA
ncbi:MAG: rubrerythrin family protein [Treponema sp. GWB1_62_6]|nr:MAG: rubrerythrin family protein [Treponema sp. GWC1_61_84]OHE70393.1 MAG: rubrerythrin family protein [Treponema sp. RIFOXYC1_FULL_61_9]OHE71047.1 MAG: rubrerythrin family protein [Treponema sp. GWB1_62_6]HCM26575.1 rubrerythrin family protein [Treponema sp.]